jgi:hypothetical protein
MYRLVQLYLIGPLLNLIPTVFSSLLVFVWQRHQFLISYTIFGSLSSRQGLSLFPDYVIQVKSLLLLSSNFSFYFDSKYCNAVQRKMGTWP